MKLKLYISPCPNDTFMFDAMIHGRIDTEGLEFEVTFADIEELNGALAQGLPHVGKASYAAFPAMRERYAILDSGSALGKGNGPLLVARDPDTGLSDYSIHIAVPGLRTTANLLMERLYPRFTRKTPYLFSDIMKIVERGGADAGVLIHEGRFVYRQRGLYLLADLGEQWEKRTGLPLPLGAILVSRELPEEDRQKVGRVLRRSIEYAMAHPEESAGFVKSRAQEMDDEVIRQHIALFVNDYSLSLGAEGRRAVARLLDIAEEDILA